MHMSAISQLRLASRLTAAAACLFVSLLPLAVAAQARPQPQPASAAVVVSTLRCEYQADPLGIDELQPRLSWQLRGEGRGLVQSAYQVEVTHGGRVVWDSGRVASRQSVHVPYGGPRPASAQRYLWRVRVWDGAGRPSAWSAPASWEMGLLSPADWTSPWV